MKASTATVTRISSPAVPEPEPGLWSNAKRFGDLLFLSGLVATDGNDDVVGGADPYLQARAIFGKIRSLFEAAGGTIDDVIKLTIYLTDIRHRPAVLKARREFFKGDFPCSTLICVAALFDSRALVEIDAIGAPGSGI